MTDLTDTDAPAEAPSVVAAADEEQPIPVEPTAEVVDILGGPGPEDLEEEELPVVPAAGTWSTPTPATRTR